MDANSAAGDGALTSHAESAGSRISSFLPWQTSTFGRGQLLLTNNFLAQVAIVFLVYFIAGKLGQAPTNIRSGNLGPVWPASGIALAGLLAYGYRVWPAVAAGAFLVAFQSPVSALTAAGQAAGATLAAASGVFFLRRIADFDPALSRLRDALALIVLGGFASSIVSASLGLASLYAAGLQVYSGLAAAWLIYWLGDATGVLLVTPLIFTLPALFGPRYRSRRFELVALLTLLVAACILVFGDPLFPIRLSVLSFPVLPFVIWAAINFGTGGASLAVFVTATIATLLTALGLGPFSERSPFINAVLLDMLFTVLAGTGLTLAAVIAERERAETEREQLIRARAAVETRLRLAAIVESSNEAVLSTTLDGIILSWNAAAQRIFGFSEPEAIGQPTSILIPPERRGEDSQVLQRLKAGVRVQPYETIRLTKSGKKLDVSVANSPLRDSDGIIIGAARIFRDITEQKRAEEALSSVSRRLIDAQEQERSRIARELHDDIGQRLAVLAVTLTGVTKAALSMPRVHTQMLELQRQVSDIASDVQALSHRLHSSRLELLGITASMRSFCAEFADQQKANVDFDAHDVPERLPADVSLCLFRILQEALHNSAKHSGALCFDAALWGDHGQIHLVVNDRGKGFDVEAAKRGRGIGLVSMEERIKLVNGELSIESQPGRGTTIHARVGVPSSPLASTVAS
jgi:PAS domain S-box-containing protein